MEQRPLTPERLKHFLELKAKRKYANAYASDKQRYFCAGLLGKCFDGLGDNDKDKRRHSIQFYLTGYAHAFSIPDDLILAMLDWLKSEPDGSQVPGDVVIAEARAVERARLLEMGQTQMQLDEQNLRLSNEILTGQLQS